MPLTNTLIRSAKPKEKNFKPRKAEKIAQAGAESFEAIAREWHAKFSPGWVASHGDRILRRLENDITLGSASGPSMKFKHQNFWLCFAESKAGAALAIAVV